MTNSLQLTVAHRVLTPANWKQGEDVIIAGSVSDEHAREPFGEWERELFGEWESPRPYIRIVRQPEPVREAVCS